MIVASYRVECDQCGALGTNYKARAENSAPWAPKDIRASAQRNEGYVRKASRDLCPACANPDPTLFDPRTTEVEA